MQLVSILLALCRAIPALEELFKQVLSERQKDREREALQRKQDKDAAVDKAIDGK